MIRQDPNDPCACGSGEKHKRCCRKHVRAKAKWDEWGSRRLERLIEFHYDERFINDYLTACEQYYGFDVHNADANFMEWFIHDYTLKDYGKSLLELFIEENSGSLDKTEMEIMSGWTRSPRCMYEMTGFKKGVGYTVRNVFDRTECFVYDISGSYFPQKHAYRDMRLYNMGEIISTSGIAVNAIAPEHKNRIVEFVLNGAEKAGHSDVMKYLKEHSLAVVWFIRMQQDVLLHMIAGRTLPRSTRRAMR